MRSPPEPKKPPRLLPPLPLRLKKPLATLLEGTSAGEAAAAAVLPAAGEGGRAGAEAAERAAGELPAAEEELATAAALPWTRPSADSDEDLGRGRLSGPEDAFEEGDASSSSTAPAAPAAAAAAATIVTGMPASAGAEVERGDCEPRRCRRRPSAKPPAATAAVPVALAPRALVLVLVIRDVGGRRGSGGEGAAHERALRGAREGERAKGSGVAAAAAEAAASSNVVARRQEAAAARGRRRADVRRAA